MNINRQLLRHKYPMHRSTFGDAAAPYIFKPPYTRTWRHWFKARLARIKLRMQWWFGI